MRNTIASALVLRDPAAAALLGALAVGGPKADFGVDFGDDYGNEGPAFGAEPNQANMLAAWNAQQDTAKRRALLEPNRNSSAKVQRYTFGMSQTLTLETAVAIALSQNPSVYIRPQRVTSNAPLPGFARLSSLQVGNVGAIVGGQIDAFDLAAVAQDAHLDIPTIGPQNTVTASGNYDALLPDGGYVTATSFRFIVSLKGPASMTPNGAGL